MNRTKVSPVAYRNRPMLALLIAGHNEELVIENTLRSAIRAGMAPEHIYVVDDNSSDRTSAIAKSILGSANVHRVRRSGKGLALMKGNRKFGLTDRYRWIHIADADGGFASNYFSVFRRELRAKNAAATGYIRSLPGSIISQYRVFEYTVGMEVHRRFQSFARTISVIPGPTSCFRADVFDKVNFANKSLTEDFDVTLQIHRMGLGNIQFISRAVAYTQDPLTLKDYVKQITRWNRGILQGMHRHEIGRHARRIDLYLSYQILQNLLFFTSFFIIVPLLALTRQSAGYVAAVFLSDVMLTFGLTFLASLRTGRWDVLSAFPFIYLYRFVSLGVFLKALVEVSILRKFRVTEGVWSTAGRRYKTTSV